MNEENTNINPSFSLKELRDKYQSRYAKYVQETLGSGASPDLVLGFVDWLNGNHGKTKGKDQYGKITDYFTEKYEKKFGVKPDWKKSMPIMSVRSHLKKFMKTYELTIEDMYKYVNAYLELRDWDLQEKGYPLQWIGWKKEKMDNLINKQNVQR